VESEAVAVALELGVTDGVPELLAVCRQHNGGADEKAPYETAAGM
jgi:hypothetical protein